MKTFQIAFLAISGLLFCFSHSHSQDWPMAGGCKERTSCAINCGNLFLPFARDTVIQSSADEMSYYNGILFIGHSGSQNELQAIDSQTGTILWNFIIQNSAGSIGVVPAEGDSIVLIGGQGAAGIYAININNGCPMWSRAIGGMYTRNPIISGDKVYVVTDSLYCLYLYNGTTLWTHPLTGQQTPTIDEDNVYVFGNGYLNAFDKNSGAIIWQTSSTYGSFAGIIVDQNYVYAEKSTSVSAYDKTSGTEIWNYALPSGYLAPVNKGPMALSGDVICLSLWDNGQGNGQVTAISRLDGTYLWHHEHGGEGAFTPAIANGMVFVVNWTEGTLYGYDLSIGTQIFSDNSEMYKNQPIVADQSLFVISSGNIVRFYATATGIEEPEIQGAELLQVSPNPFKSETVFAFNLLKRSVVELEIFNLSGSLVFASDNRLYETGYCQIVYDAGNLKPGTLIYRLKANGKEYSGKIIKQ